MRKFTAGVAAVALSFAALTTPQVMASEPGSEPVTEQELQEGAKEISFEDSKGTVFTPGETITLTADSVGEGIEIRNAYIELSPGVSTTKWNIVRGVNDEGLPTLTITAPAAPEEQTGTVLDYGDYTIHIRTSNWNSYKFTVNFAAERPAEEDPEPETPINLSSDLDFSELSTQLRGSSR